MLNKILKKTDSSGRLVIPKSLADYVGIKADSEVAICSYEDYGDEVIMIKPISEVDSCKVISIIKVDKRRRFMMPHVLLPEGRNEIFFEIYLFNGDLLMEEVYM